MERNKILYIDHDENFREQIKLSLEKMKGLSDYDAEIYSTMGGLCRRLDGDVGDVALVSLDKDLLGLETLRQYAKTEKMKSIAFVSVEGEDSNGPNRADDFGAKGWADRKGGVENICSLMREILFAGNTYQFSQ